MKDQIQAMRVSCTFDGMIADVLPPVASSLFKSGTPFVGYLEESTQIGYFDFLKNLHEQGYAFACEVYLAISGKIIPYLLNGYLEETKMQLILMRNKHPLASVLTEIVGINNKQLNELRALRKEKQDVGVTIYEEISKLNSELLNSKRIIDKQNAELIKYNQLLKNLSERDVLTAAFNRRYFYDYCKNNLCMHMELFPVCLISIDFNHFKYINDHYGHETGDRLLIEFVQIVKKVIGENGNIFRFGGDEFIIVLRNTLVPAAESVMQSIIKAFHEVNQIVSIAYGLVSISADIDMGDCDLAGFLRTADDLMYDNKRDMKKQEK